MAKLEGQKLGKYELIERMAQGGMAEVYAAFQPGVERTVVLKVLHGHLVDNQDIVARFQREARAAGRLQHPHIVRVIDIGIEDDNYFMVMDYLQGGTLGDYLKARGRIPAEAALRLAAQLIDALQSAHAQGIVHRDIKPSNILFADDSYEQVLLTDFGLASLRDDADGSLTVTGAMVGTPTYMSPEAVRGEVCDERSDLYSLGVVLYEMVTGKPPYIANTPYSMLMKQTNDPLPSPRSINPELPEAVEELLLSILAKDPAERLQTAAQLARAIHGTQQALCMQSGAPANTQPSAGGRGTSATPPVRTPVAPPTSPTRVPVSHGVNWRALILAMSATLIVAVITAELLILL